jgi:large subunit ribosomal protein L32
MPHPKHRFSKQRTAKRRTHDNAEAPTTIVCSNCGSPALYHRVCPECGYYKGKLAIEKQANA